MSNMQSNAKAIPDVGLQPDILRVLFEATTDFVFLKDLSGRYLAINDAGARALGRAPQEVIGKDDRALVAADLADRWTWEDRQVVASGVSLTFEDLMPGPEERYIHTIKSPWRNEAGEIKGVVGISRDISESKRMQRALRQVESRYQKLFASDLMGIHIPDRFGAITEANDEFLRVTGYTREDLEAGLVRWDTMTPAEYSELDALHIAEAARRGTCTPYEKEYVRKDGERVPIMCGYTLLEGSEDQYIAFIQDLTAQKKSEEAMRQAEKLNTASRFAASMAHEINNPLAAVTNLLYLALAQGGIDAEARTILEAADKELARVSRIVAQTLRFNRQSTAAATADVAGIVESALALFASRLRGDRVQIIRDYRAAEPLMCFQDELRHAFANLVGNALDAIAYHGTLRVRVRSGHRWGAGEQRGVYMSLADSGTGIPEAMRSRLFQPFVSTKEQTGTGLGLWATQNIVRKHRGQVRYRSASGGERHGTVFSVFLPYDGVRTESEA